MPFTPLTHVQTTLPSPTARQAQAPLWPTRTPSGGQALGKPGARSQPEPCHKPEAPLYRRQENGQLRRRSQASLTLIIPHLVYLVHLEAPSPRPSSPFQRLQMQTSPHAQLTGLMPASQTLALVSQRQTPTAPTPASHHGLTLPQSTLPTTTAAAWLIPTMSHLRAELLREAEACHPRDMAPSRASSTRPLTLSRGSRKLRATAHPFLLPMVAPSKNEVAQCRAIHSKHSAE